LTLKSAAFTIIGLIILVVVAVNSDLGNVSKALTAVGWDGAAALTLWRTIPIGLCVAALWAVSPQESGVFLKSALAARLTRDGVSSLLPILPAGGEIIGARVLALSGVDAVLAFGVMVADLTLEIGAQAGFSVLGVMALFAVLPGQDVGMWGLGAIALPLMMVAGLGAVQHPVVLSQLEKLAEKVAKDALPAKQIVPAIHAIYRSRGKVAGCLGLHFAGWVVGIGEAWLALTWLGHPLSVASVLALESVVFAIKGVAFIIPWSLGVQEGGYMVLGAALGVPPELALTLALLKRLPDIVLGVPGLILWHRAERNRTIGEAVAEAN